MTKKLSTVKNDIKIEYSSLLDVAVSFHRRDRYMGLHGNLGPERDVNGAGDPKSPSLYIFLFFIRIT